MVHGITYINMEMSPPIDPLQKGIHKTWCRVWLFDHKVTQKLRGWSAAGCAHKINENLFPNEKRAATRSFSLSGSIHLSRSRRSPFPLYYKQILSAACSQAHQQAEIQRYKDTDDLMMLIRDVFKTHQPEKTNSQTEREEMRMYVVRGNYWAEPSFGELLNRPAVCLFLPIFQHNSQLFLV